MFPNLLCDISSKTFSKIFNEMQEQNMINTYWEKAVQEYYSLNQHIFPNLQSANEFLTNLFQTEYLKNGTLDDLLFNKIHSEGVKYQVTVIKYFLKLLNNNIGVLCLSEICTDQKMWGLYADAHKGVTFGFDRNHPFFSNIRKVIYVQNRVELNLNALSEGSIFDPVEIFCSKSKEWEYEKEYRMFAYLGRAKRVIKKDDSELVYLFDLPIDSINMIVLGWKTQVEAEDRIISLIKEKNLKVKLKYIYADRNNFQLTIK